MNTLMNNTTKSELEQGRMLPLMEEFYTIQGEGYNSGKAAYFIRIGGCDVGCHWCDVKESWDANLHPLTAADVIIENAIKYPAKAIVITGGEPSLYNLNYITEKLKKQGILTFVETAGSALLTGTWDWICLSPKKTAPPLPQNCLNANELKVIIYNKDDIRWAEKNADFVKPDCKLYLQPEWSKSKEMMPFIVDYVMNNPKWNISLQTHKYMNIP